MDRLLLTPDDAATRLSISRAQIYRLMDLGIIPFVEVPGRGHLRTRRKIRTSDLLLWVQSLPTEGAGVRGQGTARQRQPDP